MLLVKALRTFIDTYSAILYQAMIGLDNIGEEVFAGRRSQVDYNDGRKYPIARNYLKGQDQMETISLNEVLRETMELFQKRLLLATFEAKEKFIELIYA